MTLRARPGRKPLPGAANGFAQPHGPAFASTEGPLQGVDATSRAFLLSCEVTRQGRVIVDNVVSRSSSNRRSEVRSEVGGRRSEVGVGRRRSRWSSGSDVGRRIPSLPT